MDNAAPPSAQYQSVVIESPATGDLLVGGGFFRRVAAYLIDGFILGVAALVLNIVFNLMLGPYGSAMANVLSFALSVGYFSYLESSEWQATLGKRVLGMRVVDTYGYRLSGLHAVGRYISAAVNWLLLGFGYLVVAFHPEKRGLHDMIAQTRVVLEDPNDIATPVLAWVVIGIYVGIIILGVAAAIVLALAMGGVS